MQASRQALPAPSLLFLAILSVALTANAQEPAPAPTPVTLPEAPSHVTIADPPALDPSLPHPITLGERFKLQTHVSFGPAAFLIPAAESGIIMAHPPARYPHDWSDGARGFGLNYGAELARHATGGLTHFAVAAVDREDPRYYRCDCKSGAARILHALAFTVVDRSVSGRRTFAASNFAGSAASGFVGMGIYPHGFNDTTHAYQHAALELGRFGAHNLTAEFAPEFSRIRRKLHLSGHN